MSTINDTCDELAALIEPDPTLRDDARVQPAEFFPDTLYVWPRRIQYVRASLGYEHEQQFTVMVAWAADRLGEGDPDREVSDAVVNAAEAVRDRLAAVAGRGATFDEAHAEEVDFESLDAFDVRGYLLAITGHRLLT